MTRQRIVLRGRVQAVGFRERVIEIARAHAVSGSVRNLRDGALELDVEAEGGALEAFVREVIANPPAAARIEAVAREPLPVRGVAGFRREPTA